VLEIKYFHGIGAFEAHRSKVSALKFFHPPVCSLFLSLVAFWKYHTVSKGEGGIRKSFKNEKEDWE
jgi:hypothetical protein